MTTIGPNVAHTVTFFQTAFRIVLALAFGEALKRFVSDDDDRPLHWDRIPLFVSFVLIIFPFFQGMAQHMFTTYLDPASAPPYRQAYLTFDGLVFMVQAAIIYVMARAITPNLWRRFYGALLLLLAVDIVWAGVLVLRGVPIRFWIELDVALIVVLTSVLWFEALFNTKATNDSQTDAAPLVTGAMSAQQFMQTIQNDLDGGS